MNLNFINGLFSSKKTSQQIQDENVVDLFGHFLKKNNTQGVKHFLKKGRNPNNSTQFGETPIVVAEVNQNTEMVEILYKFGATLTQTNISKVSEALGQ
ncbi:MAG: hypothetical protein ISR65_00250 [Bacteriovoracaceae bacterium]|nr:hypothetical protein [Bacteriovoracaceae bacterium]